MGINHLCLLGGLVSGMSVGYFRGMWPIRLDRKSIIYKCQYDKYFLTTDIKHVKRMRMKKRMNDPIHSTILSTT